MRRPSRAMSRRWPSSARPCPPDHPLIASSLNNLGNVQSELREYGAAQRSHEQALAILRKALPPDHPEIAQSLNNLGTVQYELREYGAAKRSHEQALAIRRKALPAGPPRDRSKSEQPGNRAV